MSSSNTSEGPDKSPAKQRRFLSAEKKFQFYLEAQDNDKPVGELLRREGLYSTDLARIRQQVIRTVQDLRGHKDVSTTQIYTHMMAKTGLGVRSPLDEPRNTVKRF